MIKTLKRKIVSVTLLSVGLVLLTMVSCMNIANYMGVLEKADYVLDILGENNGHFPIQSGSPAKIKKMRPEERFDTRYFSIETNDSGTILAVDVSRIYAVSESEAIEMAKTVLSHKTTRGFVGSYRYKVIDSSTKRIIFLDTQRELDAFYAFLKNSVLVSILGMSAVLGLSYFFSRYLLKPVEEAYSKQRRFITDASHELKTPLTIISANMDVLSISNEENQWIDSTYRQVGRMSTLVNDMLFLAKMDETTSLVHKNEVDINQVLEHVLSDYESMLSQKFILNIQREAVNFKGDADLMYRLFSCLMENAIRYGISNKPIDILLKKTHSGFKFEITNAAALTEKGNLDAVFDRFKRLDQARTQSQGGSGIGLSIAKSIVDLHGGSIHASSKDGLHFTISIEF